VATDPKQIVVVGAGNWVKQQYATALRPYKERGECGVYFIYDRSYATLQRGFTQQEIDDYNRFTEENARSFQSWGATCLDLANPADQTKTQGISPDAAFVVTAGDTHCKAAEEWLDRAALTIVEKPFDEDHERIRHLRRKIEEMKKEKVVWGFDHYVVRANQFKKMRDYLHFDKHMQEQIHEFRFYMLESTDRGMEERRASIQAGMIMDMGSHTAALVWPFGDPNTIRLDSIKAGIYDAESGRRDHNLRARYHEIGNGNVCRDPVHIYVYLWRTSGGDSLRWKVCR
jgi:predicted dehydrogenase